VSRRPASWVGTREVAVCVGGPLDGRWYFVDDLVRMQTAAVRVGRDGTEPAGVSLAYAATAGTRPHPVEDTLGAVWRHVPSAMGLARSERVPAARCSAEVPSMRLRRHLRVVA